MIAVVQRVARAEVRVGGESVGRIDRGLLLLVGVERGDEDADADAIARKAAALRLFPGRTPMDRTVLEAGGACLVVSQFTLAGSLRKGNRPSFDAALEDGTAATDDAARATIRGYNEDDCRSTLALRDWLEQRRVDLETLFTLPVLACSAFCGGRN